MAQIKVEASFGGIRPRFSKRSGNDGRALTAHNVKLWHGTLSPWRQPSLIIDHDECISSLFKHDCCFLTDKNPCAKFATGVGQCDRVFATDICGQECPVTATLPDCGSLEVVTPTWTKLGVPVPGPVSFTVPPLSAPESTPQEGWQLKREHRDYVYTYVNSFGEEGAPSLPSTDATDADSDAIASITFPSRPDPLDGWNVVAIRLYRVQTGNIDGQYGHDGVYLFVDEIDVSATPYNQVINYDDDKPVDCLAEPLMTHHFYPPPCELSGLTELEGGSLVGFVGKRLYFSEPFQYHAWPCWLDLDDCIRGVVEVANALYVATDGRPYTISSKVNEEECRCCRSVFRHPEPAPMVSDIRGIVATANGAMWPTNDGLVRVTGNSLSLVTHGDFAEDDWVEFHPHTMKGANWNGRYIGFGAIGGLYLDYTDGIYADGDVGANSRNSTLSWTPNAVFNDRQGDIYLSFGNQIRKWDDGAEYEIYEWASKINQSNSVTSWTAARLYFEDGGCLSSHSPVRFTIEDGCGDVLYTRLVSDEQPFRLPRGIRRRSLVVRIEGKSEVSAYYLATSLREISV